MLTALATKLGLMEAPKADGDASAAESRLVEALHQSIERGAELEQLAATKGWRQVQETLIETFEQKTQALRVAKTIDEVRNIQAELNALETVLRIVPAGIQDGRDAREKLRELAEGEEDA